MDLELLRRKTTQADRALRRVQARLSPSAIAFGKDYDAQDIVYRNFQIAVQNCVDMGAHMISENRWEPPRAMGEIFDRLKERRLIGAALTLSLRRMIVLRNIIVHDYARIDIRRAYPLLKASLKAIPRFCAAILKTR